MYTCTCLVQVFKSEGACVLPVSDDVALSVLVSSSNPQLILVRASWGSGGGPVNDDHPVNIVFRCLWD